MARLEDSGWVLSVSVVAILGVDGDMTLYHQKTMTSLLTRMSIPYKNITLLLENFDCPYNV